MKSIKEKAEENLEQNKDEILCVYDRYAGFVDGANCVLDAIIECMPKTHSFNPNETIDIIASRIKELKEK